MTDSPWHEMVDAYVLGALDAEERAAFEQALAGDEHLRARVAEAEDAVLVLAEGLPDVAPRPELRASVIARAREARADTKAGPKPGARAVSSDAPAAADGGSGGFRGVAPWILLAASIAGLAFLGSENASLTRQADRLAQEVDLIRAELGSANASLASLDSLAQAVSGTDVRFATLTGDAAPSLRLVWSTDRALLVVAASNLPEPEADRTYQLWGIGADGDPVGLGTFRTDATGTALVTLAEVPVGAYEVSALTDEPSGGSPQPTTTPFLLGSWSSSQD